MTKKVINALAAPKPDGTYWYSQKDLADVTELAQPTVSRHLTALLSQNVLTVRVVKGERGNDMKEFALPHMANLIAHGTQLSRQRILGHLERIKRLMVNADDEQLEVLENTLFDLLVYLPDSK